VLDEGDPFEIDVQAAHLFKHPHLGVDDVLEIWTSSALFYPAKPPAHWLMVAEAHGRVLVVPIAPSRSGDQTKCRPIGCYDASRASPRPTGGTVMTIEPPTPDEEYNFYAEPANQEPQGGPRRRTKRLTAPIPVRFPPELLAEVKRRADADDRSVSAWIRRAVEHELNKPA